MKFFLQNKRGVEARWVKIHPSSWAELGIVFKISRQTFCIRVQAFRWELIAYVQYALYPHQKPGHPSYEYWQNIDKINAERQTRLEALLASTKGGWDAPIKQEVKFRSTLDDDATRIDYRE